VYLLQQSREGNRRHGALQAPATLATTSENETETAFDAWKQTNNDTNGPQRAKDKSSREDLEQAFLFRMKKQVLKIVALRLRMLHTTSYLAFSYCYVSIKYCNISSLLLLLYIQRPHYTHTAMHVA